MYRDVAKKLFRFVSQCPTACHTVSTAAQMLDDAGYKELLEEQTWALKPGGRYYMTRGLTTLVAFKLPKTDYSSFLIAAPHGDAPGFKIKTSPNVKVEDTYTRLNTEVYGGINLNLWFDRPLSAAGRVMVRTRDGVEARLINIDRDLVVIPSLAIHMNHDANNGIKLNPQADTLPLYGMGQADFMKIVAQEAGVSVSDILSHDLYLYCRQEGAFFGENDEFIACPKLDDLQSVYTALQAFLSTENSVHVPVLAILDNEEIGSMTKQGADSTVLSDVLRRIGVGCGKSSETRSANLAGSFILSVDNGHAVHPNAVDKSDPTNRCYLNGGVVIKHSVRYATDAVSAAVVQYLCELAGVPSQTYYNRSDIPGGSTLGNIIGTHVSAHTADIGLAQLSMHSPYETGGARDTAYMQQFLTAFYSASITLLNGGKRFRISDTPKPAETSLWQDISSFSGQFDLDAT